MKIVYLGGCFLFLCSISVFSIGNQTKDRNKHLLFTEKDTVLFSTWLHDQLINRAYYYDTYGLNNESVHEFVYLDSKIQILRPDVNIVFNRKGWVKTCKVKGMPDQALNDEVKRIIKKSPRWSLNDKKCKVHFQLEIPVEGSIASLDKGVTQYFNWGRIRSGMKKYICSIAFRIYYIGGELEFSFIVNKEGQLFDIRCIREPYPGRFDTFYKKYRPILLEGPHWKPALLNGKPVSVKVVAEYSYDPIEKMRWKYYLLDE